MAIVKDFFMFWRWHWTETHAQKVERATAATTNELEDARKVIKDHELIEHLARARLEALNVWYQTRIKPKADATREEPHGY